VRGISCHAFEQLPANEVLIEHTGVGTADR
jgi:hypothetical protein